MNIDFTRTEYFLVVCECGSVSKAAEKLYITPQALNRQIRTLEDELGEPLFLRSTRKLKLSPFGEFFRNQMQTVHKLYKSASQQVESYLHSSKPGLRVGFFTGISKRRVIHPVITELLDTLPNTQIEMGSADMDQLYDDLRSGATDLAITYVNPVDTISDLVEIPLLTLSSSVVVSMNHRWAGREQLTLEELADEPVLFLSRSHGPDKCGFYSELKAASYHFTTNSDAMLAQLCLGQHYSVFPVALANISEHGLTSIPLPEATNAEFTLSLLYRPDSPYAEQFSALRKLQSSFWKTLISEQANRN